MKKVLIVAALLGVMLVVEQLKAEGASSAATLAGIGFVMLAAYAVSELGTSLSLPQVSGFILAGVLLGPSVGGVISGEVVSEMRMFNTLALGLIATSAGLELDLRQIARMLRTLVFTTLVKVALGSSLVFLVVILVERALSLLDLAGPGELITLALVLGVLSLGTSPSISLAVLRETRAKGRLADLVLGTAVFKDLVVVVGLAVAVAIGRVWLAPGAAIDGGILVDVVIELGGSVFAGALVGLVFIFYVRFVRAEMLLFVAAMILVVAELCRAFHLELLLVFITSGVVVRNFSEHEHDLSRPLALVALPVFVVFFANAGASVDLLTTWKILPLAVSVCAVRAFAYYVAGRLGGSWAGEPRTIRRNAWLAYLPQAGVTLGLVGLAALQLPELSTPITNTGMAMVALNLITGPLTLRRALAKAGEIPGVPGEPEGDSEPPAGTRSSLPSPLSLSPGRPLPKPLRTAQDALRRSLGEVVARFEREVRPRLPALPPLGREVPDAAAFQDIAAAHRAAWLTLYAELTAALGQLPPLLRLTPATDRMPARGALAWLRRRGRKLPLRRLAHIALGPPLSRYVARELEASLGGERREPTPEGALPAEIETGLGQLAELARDAGTRRLPLHKLRYSNVEPQVRRALQGLATMPEAELAQLVRAAWGSALLAREREQVTRQLDSVLTRLVKEPARQCAASAPLPLASLIEWLEQRSRRSPSQAARLSERPEAESELAMITHSALGELAREFRFTATVRSTVTELQACAAQLPARIDCLQPGPEARLVGGRQYAVPFQQHVEALVRHLLPPLDVVARDVSGTLNQLPRRAEDTLRAALATPEGLGPELPISAAARRHERLRAARESLEALAAATAASVEESLAAFEAAAQAAYAAFRAEVVPGPAPRRREASLRRRLSRAWARAGLTSARLAKRWQRPRPLGDAAAVLRSLSQRRTSLPPALERWFDGAPVGDERIFVGHRALLDRILDAESQRSQAGYAAVLIVGAHGSGKSSLLNMCELELPQTSHLRLHPADFAPDTSLFDALGSLLDCAPTGPVLARHIAQARPAIFVDDLARWIVKGPRRRQSLGDTLQLITETRGDAFWLASIDLTLLRLLGELVSIEELFTHVLHLPRLGQADIQKLVESRLELSGFELTFRTSRWAALLDSVLSRSESERVYRRLLRASGGAPNRVLALCRQGFVVDGARVTLDAERIGAPGPLRYQLSHVQLSLLATLHRYGSKTLGELSAELHLTPERVSRVLVFLSSAGLVQPSEGGDGYQLPRHAEWSVHDTLIAAGVEVEA